MQSKELKNKKYTKLTNKIIKLQAIAESFGNEDFDLSATMNDCISDLQSLGAQGHVQEMLAAQILSIHKMQQTSIALANNSSDLKHRQYFTNAAIKLANCFTQQVSLLNRLQGNGNQKIVVEHVEVHNGGQAVVGNIKAGGGNESKR